MQEIRILDSTGNVERVIEFDDRQSETVSSGPRMTADEYEKLPPEEQEHVYRCPECGQFVDKRELRDVIFHATDHKPKPHIPETRCL
jgi:predicted RNA-binding Zn-ribbon protein involved in translation (DUF1610 family)